MNSLYRNESKTVGLHQVSGATVSCADGTMEKEDQGLSSGCISAMQKALRFTELAKKD